jgi:hypothetical protein
MGYHSGSNATLISDTKYRSVPGVVNLNNMLSQIKANRRRARFPEPSSTPRATRQAANSSGRRADAQ